LTVDSTKPVAIAPPCTVIQNEAKIPTQQPKRVASLCITKSAEDPGNRDEIAPNRWFHQHFNIGGSHARYLALHTPMQFHGHAEKVEDRAKDQIEYPDKAPFIRKKFEEELAKRGVKSLMPDEAYTNRNYEWSKAMGKR